jgi:hypothetical protein
MRDHTAASHLGLVRDPAPHESLGHPNHCAQCGTTDHHGAAEEDASVSEGAVAVDGTRHGQRVSCHHSVLAAHHGHKYHLKKRKEIFHSLTPTHHTQQQHNNKNQNGTWTKTNSNKQKQNKKDISVQDEVDTWKMQQQ